MKKDNSTFQKLDGVRRDLLRGDNIFALLILMVVGVLLVNMVVSIWHNVLFQQELKQKTALRNIRTITFILARTCEPLLATNELSLVRRTVADIARENELDMCRIELPDGGVLADADPSRITVIDLPDSWSNDGVQPKRHEAYIKEYIEDKRITLHIPLNIPGKEGICLKVAGSINRHLGIVIESQTGPLAMACLALAIMLLVHRHARFRLKAMGAIHDALLGIKNDEWDISSLQLDPRLGQEAVAWNRLLSEHKGRQIHSTMEQIKETIHQSAEAQGDFAAACNALPYGMILVDEDRRVIYANGAAGILLQTPIEDINTSDIRQLTTDERVHQAIEATLAQPESPHHLIDVRPKDAAQGGVLRYMVCSIHREGRRMVALFIEDITQYTVAKAARDSFLAQAAHELRTPLTNVRLYVEHALEECEKDVARTIASLNIVNEESQRLSRVVSEILSVSEIEVGSFCIHKDDVRLDALFAQLQSDYEVQAQDKKITLTFNLPPKLPVLQGDRDKLSLALHNILGNALKYTSKQGHVTVTVTVEEDRVCIAVTDTGIGIHEDELEKIFEKFYRSKDKRIHGITGSGLGLPIAREVVRLHAGDLKAASEWDKGSTFTVILPLSEEAKQGEHSSTTGRSSKRHQAGRPADQGGG